MELYAQLVNQLPQFHLFLLSLLVHHEIILRILQISFDLPG